MKTRAIIALIVTMLVWGWAAVFLRTLAVALAPENALAARYAVLTVVNLAVLGMRGTWRIPRADWPRFLTAGVIAMGGYSVFSNMGYGLVPAGLSTIIIMVQPLLIAALAFLLLGEPLSPFVFVGAAVVLVGALVLFWPDLMATTPAGVSPLGVAYLLLGCLGWALYTILVKPLFARHDSLTITSMTMLVAAPFMLALGDDLPHRLLARLDARQWLELLYLAIPGGLIGTLLWNFGARHVSAAATGAFLYLIPVIAVTAAALTLHEPVTWNIVAGGLIMVAGLAAAQLGPLLRLRR